ncbi:preprotein translocase subunit SecG [Dehalobacterium formicoaceticum]|uniref:Protein-export membrane protein SecG n=1 Tax=Dehalobacterium formicoaceticum TaxID=51515 RepID=A0ABT1Y2Q8_9FIRM|nr:preprotein translocase subunit SecG [Dehalobacterium formicoaceticum]MCR6545157.1 preprotein translocase subunit SecG [Dehalobacterium formicoaceticum]
MLKTFLMIIQVLVSLGLIATVLLQSGKSAGMSGAIAGGAETFFGKKKGMDELLSKITAYLAIGFLVITLMISIVF